MTDTTNSKIHRSLPQTKTKENLGKWITENQKNILTDRKEVPLEPEEVAELEHKSSIASRSIDKLEKVKEQFMLFLKKGTPFDSVGEKHLPQSIIIPPTKGMDDLKANRENADKILEDGYNVIETKLYVIPFTEESTMVAVDIEGEEWPTYTKPMTPAESELYGNLFKKKDGKMVAIDNKDIDVKRDGSARLKTKQEPFI